MEERTGFSDFKEILPETVTATSVRGMVLEVMARTEVFNAFKRGEGGDNEGHRERGGGGLTRRRRGQADLFIVSDLSNRVR